MRTIYMYKINNTLLKHRIRRVLLQKIFKNMKRLKIFGSYLHSNSSNTLNRSRSSLRRVPRAGTMPLPFNKTLDLKLLKLVRENPIIYNKKHSKYLDFDTREVVWQKIGDVLNRPAPICKSRWINIRDMMRRKIRDRLRNPNHRSYNYKYEEELSFMLPFFNETTNASDEFADFLEEANACEVEMPPEVFANRTDFDCHEAREVKPNIHFRKRQEDSCFSNEFQELNPADPLDVFLITIGSTLRKFSPYYLNQAKSKIFQVVQDYELQQIVNKDDQPGSSDGNR